MMTNRRWLLTTMLTILSLLGANLLLIYKLDIYGILRDPHGRRLASSGLHSASADDRISKYMLNQRYVPANFDSLLIGSSTSGNWNTDLIQGFHMYNESLAAGNSSEEKTLVDQSLPTGHFRLALCAISPHIFISHDLKQGLGDVTRSEAFGSVNSFGELGAKALISLHLQPPTFFPNGSRELFVAKRINYDLPPSLFDSDPQAVAAYRSLIESLQSRGIKVIYLVPPLYSPLYQKYRPQFDQFLQKMQTALPPAPIIDFTSPEFAGYNNNLDNFSDGVHMTPSGAEAISRILNEKLAAVLSGPSPSTGSK
jgi:hypothetical protein